MALAAKDPKAATLLTDTGMAISAYQTALASGQGVAKAQATLTSHMDQAAGELGCAVGSPSPSSTP